MVLEIIKTSFFCPFCDTEHDNYENAWECLKECALEDKDVFEERITKFVCEMCEKVFSEEESAFACEAFHEKYKDKNFEEWKRRKEFEKLEIASKAKGQKNN